MNDAGDRYVPVDCGFHDELEERAALRRPTVITYRDPAGDTAEVSGVIEDVFSRGGAEYLRLHGGTEIQLDRILRVGDH